MATATLITNTAEYRPEFRVHRGVQSGKTHYQVFCETFSEALLATGLPAVGSAYAPAPYDRARARTFTPVYEGGLGWWRVEVSYEEDSVGSWTPRPDFKITTLPDFETASESALWDLEGNNRLGESGVQLLRFATSFRVLAYQQTVPTIPAVVAAGRAVKNNAPVTLPNYLGGGTGLVVPKGQLLYAGYKPGREGDLYSVEHLVMRAESWDAKVLEFGEDLKPAAYVDRVVYDEADFSTLF